MGVYHPIMIHWMLNPGLVLNELGFGQVVGRDVFSCAKCSPAFMHNIGKYLSCPGCGRAHRTDLWQGKNSFGHWRGMICPDCAGTIPRAWNATSLLFLSLTFILWWPILKMLGDNWRKAGQEATQNARDKMNLKEQEWPVTLQLSNEESSRAPELSVPGLKVAPVAGLGTCPYCHDQVEKAEGVACTDCLARHHEECWDEHKECATCGGISRYGSVERSEGRDRGSKPIREKA